MSDQNTDRYLELFLEESTEQIDLLNDSLLLLEKEGAKAEIVEDIFRSAHTLKSSAAFVGQNRMSELAHKMEDLLQKIREGRLGIQTELINLFFQIVDRLRASIETIANGEDLQDDFSDLKAAILAYDNSEQTEASVSPQKKAASEQKTLAKAQENTAEPTEEPLAKKDTGQPPSQEQKSSSAKPQVSGDTKEGLIQLSDADLQKLQESLNGRKAYSGRVVIDPDAPMKNMRFLLLAENLVRQFEFFLTDPPLEDLEKEAPVDAFRFIVMGNVDRDHLEKECQIDLVTETLIKDIEFQTQASPSKAAALSKPTRQESHVLSKNIKVSADKIDYLMNNVGELVILNSGLQKVYEDLNVYLAETGMLTELKGKIDQSSRIVRDLQSGIMKTRMMPVGLVFHRFARPIRDLASKLGKKVELKLSGEDTELDKNIIDSLGEPLLHLMRNSLDHGIEPEEERLAKGKPATATLSLQAYQSGNNVFIEIRDDGRGLDRKKILETAISRGIVSADANLTDEEVYRLIFAPGFSTADEVTDISGRGVGMGVVSSLMEEFKGSVQIQNQPGEGCAIILSFPLTLAIISAVLVRLGNEEYAFPLADVVETIVISKDEVTSLQGREIVNLRGDILSILRLSTLLGLPSETAKDHLPLVIVNSGNRKVGFVVDALAGKMEIVIKSLEQNFQSVEGLIGACLLGDGRIIMVLDVHGLLGMANKKINYVEKTKEVLAAVEAYNDFIAHSLQQEKSYQERIEIALKKKLGLLTEDGKERPTKIRTQAITQIEQITKIEDTADTTHDPSKENKADPESKRSPNESLNKTSGEHLLADSLVADKETDTQKNPELAFATEARPKDILDEISNQELEQLSLLVKQAMKNAGEVLSQLLGVEMKVSVPEFETLSFDELSTKSQGPCYAIQLHITGDMDGMTLLVFDHDSGLNAAGELMGVSKEELSSMPKEDIESVLCELSNICGSSILNEFSNRTGLTVMPGPPEFYEGEYKEVVTAINQAYSLKEELQVLYIMADFFRAEVEFFGRLYVIPTTKSMAKMLNRL